MELRQLEYFIAVAEEANFTRAAQRVHISQSGVSAQIRQLEHDLGATLIDRSGRTATVTAGAIENAIAVPDAAVLRDDDNRPFVYVATGPNQFGRRAIEVGESESGRTQILTGLSIGERVVGDGSLFLQFANSLQQ